MENYINRLRHVAGTVVNRLLFKLIQPADYYPVRNNRRIRRSKYDMYTH